MSVPSTQETFSEKAKRLGNNCLQSTVLCCFQVKEKSQIALLEQNIVSRQRQFGVEYLELVEKKATQEELKACLSRAVKDINEIQTKINSHYDTLDVKVAETNEKIIPPTGGSQAAGVTASQPSVNQNRKKPVIKTPSDSGIVAPTEPPQSPTEPPQSST